MHSPLTASGLGLGNPAPQPEQPLSGEDQTLLGGDVPEGWVRPNASVVLPALQKFVSEPRLASRVTVHYDGAGSHRNVYVVLLNGMVYLYQGKKSEGPEGTVFSADFSQPTLCTSQQNVTIIFAE